MGRKCANCSSESQETNAYCDACGISFMTSPPFEDLGESIPQRSLIRSVRPYIGDSDEAALKKGIRYTLICIAALLGAMTSPWGHIYTTGWNLVPQYISLPPLYLFIYLVSYISPRLAMRCPLAFCLADFI